MHTWRMRKKNLCAYGKCAKGIYAQMENATNCRDSCKLNFSISVEYAKILYVYIENAHKESKCTWRMRERIYVHIEYARKESMRKMENAWNSVIFPN
jgi:hypothetical protein